MKRKILILFVIILLLPNLVSDAVCGGADTSGDSIVDIQELTSYIAEWKNGSVGIVELMEAIGEWKSGCS